MRGTQANLMSWIHFNNQSMRTRINPVSLPLWLPSHPGLILETNIRLPGQSRLLAKACVFDTQGSLRRFWREALDIDLGPCLAAVNSLRCLVEDAEGPQGYRVDRRFFCVIGLTRGNLDAMIIAHEAVHAAYAYIKRVRSTPWEARALAFDEEAIAYPAGYIAEELHKLVSRNELRLKAR